VCLFNNNEIIIEGFPDYQPDYYLGALKRRYEGFELYAKRGEKDCENISIGSFKPAAGAIDIGQIIVSYEINQEEVAKKDRGEEYLVNIPTTTIKAENTKIVISLRYWVPVLGYFIILFAWSFIFFQFREIFRFMSGDKS
jgi:hypothetical protein